jgi:hypothetical protein
VLVITVQTGSQLGGPAGSVGSARSVGSAESVGWAGRRHDDDRPDASSGASSAELFDAVFHALHDGEQVALGFDCPLTLPVSPDQGVADADELVRQAEPAATWPGITELGHLLGELGTWRPWTTVSTSLSRWKANTSILVWEAVPAEGSGTITASAAADSFFRQLQTGGPGTEAAAGTVVNLAAATARRAGLFVDASELGRPAVSITVTGG